MYRIVSGCNLENIPTTSWGGKHSLKNGAYQVQNDKNQIELTIEDTDADSVDSEAILQYLEKLKVIENAKDWGCEKIDDSSGFTFIDDLWTTLILVRHH